MLLNFEIILISFSLLGLLSLLYPVNVCVHSVKQLPIVSILLLGIFSSVLLTAQNQTSLSLDDIDESRFVRIGLLSILCILAWLIFARRGFPSSRLSKSLIMTFAFSLFGMISYFYSSNPLLSLWKGFEVFAAASVFLAIASCIETLEDVDHAMNILWFILLFLIITALIGGALQPSLAFVRQVFGQGSQAYEYWGIFPRINPNSLTQFGAMVGTGGLIALLYARNIIAIFTSTFVLALGGITIYLGHSRTSLLGFLIVAISTLWFGKRRLLGFVVMLVGSIIATVAYTYLQEYVLRGQSKAVLLSMSGRTEFWPQVWEAFMESPIIGHGYYAGHRALTLTGLATVSSVDNTYLEVLVDLGTLGLAILLMALTFSCLSLYSCRPYVTDPKTAEYWRPTWLLMIGCLMLVGIRSFTGPTFQVLHPNLLIFLAISVCGASASRIISHSEQGRA